MVKYPVYYYRAGDQYKTTKHFNSRKDRDEFLEGWFNWSTDVVKAPVFLKLNDTAQIDVGTFSG